MPHVCKYKPERRINLGFVLCGNYFCRHAFIYTCIYYNSHNSAVPLLKRVACIVWNREIHDNLFGACDNDNVLGLQLLCPGTLPHKACQSQPTTNKARRFDSDF